MGALALIAPDNVPVARRLLADLQATIGRRSVDLERLKAGRRRLAEQLEVVDAAKNELASLISQDSRTLMDRIREGIDFGLAGFGGPRATRLAESLAASRLQNEIGSKASAELDSEIDHLAAELETLRSERPAHIRAVLIESAAGLRADYASAIDSARDSMVALAALERATGVERHGRIVGSLPDFAWTNQVGDRSVSAPEPAINKAIGVWRRFADALERDVLANAEDFLEFDGAADVGEPEIVTYERLTSIERRHADARAAR
jgi:hypothetical protein